MVLINMTKKIGLISCVSKKLNCKTKAKDLYTSPLFKYSLAYARKLNPDKIYILSAKYGLRHYWGSNFILDKRSVTGEGIPSQ